MSTAISDIDPADSSARIRSEIKAYVDDDTDIRDIRQASRTVHDTETKLVELVGMFAKERDTAARRRKTLKWAVGILVPLVVTALGTYQSVTDHVKPVEAAEVERAVNGRTKQLEKKTDLIDGRVRRLGEHAIELQVQQVEATEYLADKIDAAHPKEAAAVPEPDSLRAAKKKVAKIKTQKRVDELFRDVDPDRPLEPTAPQPEETER